MQQVTGLISQYSYPIVPVNNKISWQYQHNARIIYAACIIQHWAPDSMANPCLSNSFLQREPTR